MNSPPNGYRPDIDGLRAIAILAVVAYHAGLPGINGGFVGVDIFFVISGYLITNLLQREVALTGRIDLGRFIAKRIRRLLPVFSVVMLASLVAAMLTMFPQDLPKLGRSTIAAALVSSNFHFLKYSGGYFDPATDLMPLLHTWSLGVEEQYYLVWPLLLWGVWRLATALGHRQSNIVVLTLLGVLAVSFFANLFSVEHQQAMVFYMMPFRAWEFAVGGILVWLEPGLKRYPAWVGESLFVIGSTLTLGSICYLNDISLYPGWQALFPVAGAAALMASGSNAQAKWAGKLLGSRPMVRIGLVSYAWYLWHWPMLALMRAHDLGSRALTRDLGVAFMALLLSWMTYRFIELPIRYNRPAGFKTTRGTLLSGCFIILTVCIAAQGVVEFGKYREGRLNNLVSFAHAPADAARQGKCEANQSVDDCSVGPANAPIKVIAWGDSHIGHWSPTFVAQADRKNQRILIRSTPTCPPLLGAVPYEHARGAITCGKKNDQEFAEIRRLAMTGELRGIVVSARWNEYQARQKIDPGATTSRALADNWTELGPLGEGRASVGTFPYDHQGSVQAMGKALARTVDALSGLGLRILIVAPVPELHFDGPQCLYLRSEAECIVHRNKVEERRSKTMEILQSAGQGRENVRIFDPIDEFCDARTCFTKRNGVLQYTDHNHVSPQKATDTMPAMEPFLTWLQGEPPRQSPVVTR